MKMEMIKPRTIAIVGMNFGRDMKHDLQNLSQDYDSWDGYYCIPKVCMDGWEIQIITPLSRESKGRFI